MINKEINEIDREELFLKKLEKFFVGYFENLIFDDILGGINPRDIKSLGAPTIRGMVAFLAEYKLPESLGKMEHPFFITKERDSPEKECLDLIHYLHSLLELPDLKDRPCLPVFRRTYKHFEKGVSVMVFYKGSWVPGTVIVPNKPMIVPYYRGTFPDNCQKNNVEATGIFAQQSAIAPRPGLRIQIKGDEPQIVDVLHCDGSIFRLDEYQYIISGKDHDFLRLLQENIKNYSYGFFRDCSLQVKAVAELVRLSSNSKYQLQKGDEIMVFLNNKWTEGVVYVAEDKGLSAVIETKESEPEMIILTKEITVIPLGEWNILQKQGAIPQKEVGKE